MERNASADREFGDWLGRKLQVSRKSQQWLADRVGVSRPYITAWCNGQKLPKRPLHLALLATLLDEDPSDVAVRAHAKNVRVVLDIYDEQHIVHSEQRTTSEFLSYVQEEVPTAHNDWHMGNPQRAKRALNKVIVEGERRLRYELRKGDQRQKRKMLNQLREGLILGRNQRVLALHSISLREHILRDTQDDYHRAMVLVGEMINTANGERALLNLASRLDLEAKSMFADSFYVAWNWEGGAQFAAKVVETAEADDPWQITTLHRSLRCLLLCNAHLGKLDMSTQNYCLELLDSGVIMDFPDRIGLWESISRVNNMFQLLREGNGKLDRAERECQEAEQQGKPTPIFFSTVIRGRLIALRYTPSAKRDLDYAAHVAREGLRISRQYHFKRHYQQYLELIEEFGIQKYFSDDELNNPMAS